MEDKKALQINCAVCDVRGVTERVLSAYESVKINAATVITNQAAQTLLAKHNVKINCAGVRNLEDDVCFTTFNGSYVITPSASAPEEKTFLMLNGTLDIEPGSEEALKGYAAIVVNGSVNCPKSLRDLLGGKLTVNGRLDTYPDGCVRLKDTTILDRFFHLRARQDAAYYAAKRIVALAPDINFAKLAEKNVRFETKKLLVTESLAETAIPFFGEAVDITVFPDGCAYVDDDAVLDEAFLKRYGGSLYITGDLTILAGAAGLLEQVSYLRVDGDLLVARSLKDKVLSMNIEYDDLHIVGGTILFGSGGDQITAYMLEQAEDGLSVIGCAHIGIAADVSPELLREKLVSVIGCASVTCATEEQSSVLSLLAKDVASISVEGREDGGDKEDEDDGNAVRINSAFYTL